MAVKMVIKEEQAGETQYELEHVDRLSKLVELLTVRVSELQDKLQLHEQAITRLRLGVPSNMIQPRRSS